MEITGVRQGPRPGHLEVELRDLGRRAEGELWFVRADGELRIVPVNEPGPAVIDVDLD